MKKYYYIFFTPLLCSCKDTDEVSPKFNLEFLTDGTWNCHDIRKGHFISHQHDDPIANERMVIDSVTYQFTFNKDFTYTGRRWMALSKRNVLFYWNYIGSWDSYNDLTILRLYGTKPALIFQFEIISLTKNKLTIKYLNKPANELDTLYFEKNH